MKSQNEDRQNYNTGTVYYFMNWADGMSWWEYTAGPSDETAVEIPVPSMISVILLVLGIPGTRSKLRSFCLN